METKKIRINKPSAVLYVWLFIFYAIWMLQAYYGVSYYFVFGLDQFSNFSIGEWLFTPVVFIGGLLCFYAVIKVLRGDRDCITALKWALIYSFLYTILNPTRFQFGISKGLIFILLFIARPLFYLGFYLYLCLSKAIKRRYPKPERRFAPSGWMWLGITGCLLGIVGWEVYDAEKTNQYCKRMDVQNLLLEEGQLSDGYVAFRSQMGWTPTSAPVDTFLINDEYNIVICERTLEVADSLYLAVLFSGRSENRDARTHNQILAKMLHDYDRDIVETAHRDTLICDKYLISTSFESKSEAEPMHITLATVFDTNSPKCIVLAYQSTDKDNQKWLDDILGSLKWDLQNITKAKHEKKGNDYQDDTTQRIGYSDNKPNPYVLGGFLKGRAPRFLLGEMLLEHHKREIAYSQGYNPSYY